MPEVKVEGDKLWRVLSLNEINVLRRDLKSLFYNPINNSFGKEGN